jgi:hypothetical protein
MVSPPVPVVSRHSDSLGSGWRQAGHPLPKFVTRSPADEVLLLTGHHAQAPPSRWDFCAGYVPSRSDFCAGYVRLFAPKPSARRLKLRSSTISTSANTSFKRSPILGGQSRPVSSSPDRRDHPVIFSATFFTSSSTGIEGSPVVLHPNHAARLHALAFLQVLYELVKREAVEHAVRGHSALARHLDAPARKINLAARMGIGVDAHHASKFERPLVPAPIQIETPWVRVDFDGNAMGGAGGEDALNIDFVSRPSEQLTPGHVPKDGGVRICNCADDRPHPPSDVTRR